MQPPIPISPFTWWLLQLALAIALVRWASRALKSVSTATLAVGVLIWLMLTVPGFEQKVVRYWREEVRPRLAEVVRIGGQGVEKGMDRYIESMERSVGR